MSNPLDLIKQGLENFDIELCRQGYLAMTGQLVETKKPHYPFPEQEIPVSPEKEFTDPLLIIPSKSKKTRKKKTSVELDKIEMDELPQKHKHTHKSAKTSISEYVRELEQLEKDNYEKAVQSGGQPITGKNMIELDCGDIFQEEKKVGEQLQKAQKTKEPPRPSIKFVKRKCPMCNDDVEIPSNEVGLYLWNSLETTSEKSLYRCPSCLGG